MKGFKYTATPVTRTNLLAYKVLEEMWSSFHGFVSCFTDIHGLLIQLWAVTDLISCHCILDFFSFLRITHIETYLACCLFKSLHFFFSEKYQGEFSFDLSYSSLSYFTDYWLRLSVLSLPLYFPEEKNLLLCFLWLTTRFF